MTSKSVALLYSRIGKPAPSDIAAPSTEKVRNTRRKLVNGVSFRSTLEADVYQWLCLLQKGGQISGLEVQPRFVLQAPMRYEGKAVRAIIYIADFSFVRQGSGEKVVIDAKGYRMQVYRIKRKLFLEKYPDVVFQEWTRETLREMNR